MALFLGQRSAMIEPHRSRDLGGSGASDGGMSCIDNVNITPGCPLSNLFTI